MMVARAFRDGVEAADGPMLRRGNLVKMRKRFAAERPERMVVRRDGMRGWMRSRRPRTTRHRFAVATVRAEAPSTARFSTHLPRSRDGSFARRKDALHRRSSRSIALQ